jgi:hypothetical protein
LCLPFITFRTYPWSTYGRFEHPFQPLKAFANMYKKWRLARSGELYLFYEPLMQACIKTRDIASKLYQPRNLRSHPLSTNHSQQHLFRYGCEISAAAGKDVI